jgi:histidinol-phosphate aminotransferase
MSYFRESIERMAGYTPGFQPKAVDVVKLNTNENPYPPSPKVMEAIRNLPAEKLRRYPEPMGDTFRRAAAPVLGVRPENIICTNGGDDLLNICVRAFCDAGRPLAYPDPTYSLYPVLARLQGCPVVEPPRRGDWLDALAEANAALTIVCNPNAPTSDFVDVDKLGRLARRLRGVLLIDEAYVDFAEDNAIRLVESCPNVIVLRSMSKGYSLAGMRFGFGVARPEMIEGLVKVRDSYPVDAAAIAAAAAAIADQSWHKEQVEKIKAQRGLLARRLRELGLETADSQTNFLLTRCTSPDAKTIYERLTQSEIYVRYFALPGLEDKLRITVGTPEQNEKLLTVLTAILNKGTDG